jgi:hypothetical protein
MPFSIDPAALEDAAAMEREHYSTPSFDGFSDAVFGEANDSRQLIADPDLHRTYLDALMDLHRLVDEYRFEALLALTILRDYVIKRDRGDAPTVKNPGNPVDSMPWPAEVIVVTQRYAISPPNAARLFEDPHQEIAGGRILSRWFAAQLIDSALYRGIAACDRLAILLRCRAGLPVALTKRNERRQPSFSRGAMKQLEPSYAEYGAWPALRDLAGGQLLEFMRQERNGFTHERRRPSELHGERAMVYGSTRDGPQDLVGVMNAQTHYALAPAFYNEVLVPAIEGSGDVIVAKGRAERLMTPPAPDTP